MENLDKELETLRFDMNKRINEIKAKIENPALIDGDYYVGYDGDYEVLIKFKSIRKTQFGDCIEYYYGIVGGTWKQDDYIANNCIQDSLRPATPQEVKAALEKEILKKFNNGKKFKCLGDGRETNFSDVDFGLFEKNGRIYSNESVVYDNGTWATPIKPMSTSEYVKDFYATESYLMLQSYLDKNNLKIVENEK